MEPAVNEDRKRRGRGPGVDSAHKKLIAGKKNIESQRDGKCIFTVNVYNLI